MLTDAAIKRATCPPDKARARFADSGGLYLEVAATGSKRWFWKFRIEGKEKRIALGSYPEVTLKAARDARDDARKLQREGIDPVLQRRVDKLDNLSAGDATFEAVAREFHATHKGGWSPHYARRWLERLEKDLFPFIGPLQLNVIKAPLLLHFGETDPIIPPEDVEKHREALPGAEIRVWPAGHGFNCDVRADYNPEVAQRAMERTLHFLEQTLHR